MGGSGILNTFTYYTMIRCSKYVPHNVHFLRKGLLSVSAGTQVLLTFFQVDPEMRVRFTSPHPKDFPDEVGRPLIMTLMITFNDKALFSILCVTDTW